MKIQIILSDKEKELFKKLGASVQEGEAAATVTESVKAPNRKWGKVEDYSVEIYEPCVEDAVNITLAIIPKIKSLFTFIRTLAPLIKGSYGAFTDKWAKEIEVSDIPDGSPAMKANGANSVSISNSETANGNNPNDTPNNNSGKKKHAGLSQ